MRKSSRGNPYHDEKGRFTTKGNTKITVNNEPEYYEERTRERNVNERNEGKVGRIEKGVSERRTSLRTDRGERERPQHRDETHRGSNVGTGYVLRKPDVEVHPTQDSKAFKDSLSEARENNKYGCYVDEHTTHELSKMKMYISTDGKTGIAVEDNGNICCAFNCNKKVSAVKNLLKITKENGGTKMDCYGEDLVEMYEKNGFVAVAKIPYNDDYIEDLGDFNKVLRENKPDVYVLMLSKSGETKISSIEELNNLPTFTDYDEALTYRDNLLEEQERK